MFSLIIVDKAIVRRAWLTKRSRTMRLAALECTAEEGFDVKRHNRLERTPFTSSLDDHLFSGFSPKCHNVRHVSKGNAYAISGTARNRWGKIITKCKLW